MQLGANHCILTVVLPLSNDTSNQSNWYKEKSLAVYSLWPALLCCGALLVMVFVLNQSNCSLPALMLCGADVTHGADCHVI